jgi:hypothetical protein
VVANDPLEEPQPKSFVTLDAAAGFGGGAAWEVEAEEAHTSFEPHASLDDVPHADEEADATAAAGVAFGAGCAGVRLKTDDVEARGGDMTGFGGGAEVVVDIVGPPKSNRSSSPFPFDVYIFVVFAGGLFGIAGEGAEAKSPKSPKPLLDLVCCGFGGAGLAAGFGSKKPRFVGGGGEEMEERLPLPRLAKGSDFGAG